jgi:ribonuclease P protein component
MGNIPVQYGKATLKKEERLSFRSEFDYVHNSGKGFPGRLMVLVSAPCPESSINLRFGIICSKKISKSAVQRNRCRRLLRESIRLLKAKVKPCHVIFIARRGLLTSSLQETQKEMMYFFNKAEMWLKEQ